MPQFVLIDHSLSGPGSHHYEYAVHILRAADQLGLDTVLACHNSFRDSTRSLQNSRLIPLFRYSTYGGNTLARPNDHRATGTSSGVGAHWYHSWQQRRRARRQRQRLQAFRSSCAALLAEVTLSEGDHVFVPTMSEFDLLALNEPLRNDPTTLAAQWHLQFHFDFLAGRPPDYGDQHDRLVQMRERFETGLAGLAHHRLRFYSTTREMADQYNRLEVAPFRLLEYPVNAALRPLAETSAGLRPLRVVSAGRVRDEKGSRQLAQLVDDLWPDLLATREIQLLVQGRSSQLKRLLNRPVASCSQQQLAHGELPASPIVQIPFPLPQQPYAQLIQQADLGLFLYDSYRYYARCSGVLVEMLACGTPVIVPSGCWLAEEIAEPNQTYLAWLRSCLPLVAEPTRFELHLPAGAEQVTKSLSVPGTAGVLSIQSLGAQAAVAGCYVCWEVVQLDVQGRQICRSPYLQTRAFGDGLTSVTVPLRPQAASILVSARNAYHAYPIEISEVQLGFHDSGLGLDAAPPLGAVGLAAADLSQVPRLVREMVDRYEHYRATARAFSHSYRAIHQPSETVRQLISSKGVESRESLVQSQKGTAA